MRTDEMARGQAEHLMGMLDQLIGENNVTWQDLDALAVGVGPGNFTGIRISVSAARGLALALNIPAIGVSMFEVVHRNAQHRAGSQLISLPAPRDSVYVQLFSDTAPIGPARYFNPQYLPDDFQIEAETQVIGHAARAIAAPFGADFLEVRATDTARQIAEIAATRVPLAGPGATRPTPMYVRAPDAAPPRITAPVMLP